MRYKGACGLKRGVYTTGKVKTRCIGTFGPSMAELRVRGEKA